MSDALARLGIGTMPVPTLVDASASATVTVVATSAQACAPAVPVGVVTPPGAVSALAERQATHTHRSAEDPPHLRGPPAPLDTPACPNAAAGGGGAAPGGVGGDRDCAIHGDAIAFELPDGALTVVPASCDHVAPASSNAAARAPPLA